MQAQASGVRELAVIERNFDAEQLDKLKGVFAKLFDERSPALSDALDDRWWVTLDRVFESKEVDTVKTLLGVFCRTPALKYVRKALGNDLVFVLRYCILRRFVPSEGHNPAAWHFDSNICGPDVPMFNCWTPLVDIGETAPGITLAREPRTPKVLWDRVKTVADEAGGWIYDRNRSKTLFTPEEVAAAGVEDSDLVTPHVKAGSTIIFNQDILHRTQELQPQMGIRDSMEIRVVPSAVVEAGRIPPAYMFIRVPEIG